MTGKEALREKIETERKKLNRMLEEGSSAEDAYHQSVVLDRLIEQYIGF